MLIKYNRLRICEHSFCHLLSIIRAGAFVCFNFVFLGFVFFNNAYATYPPSFSDCLTGDGEEYDQVDACRQLLQSNSKNYKLHVALTKTLDKRQKYKQSLDAYHKALQAFPNDDYFLKKRLIAESNYKEQQWLRNKKQGTNTKPVISKAESQFKLNKIRCTRMTGKAALEACEKAIKVNDKDSILFVSMGDIHASQQQNKQAIIAYKSAIKLNPDDKLTSQKLKKLTQRKELTKKKQTSQKPAQTKKVQSVKSKPVKNTDSVNTSAPISKKVVSKPEKTQVTSHLDKTVKQSSSKPSSAKVSSSKKAQSNTLKPEQQQFLEQLNLLRSLKEQEIISQAEYEQRKNALLDKTFRVATQEKEKTVSKVISQPAKKTIDSYKGLNFGNYHALIIGNNQYKHLPKLETAVNDAESLAELLKENYGFKVKLLLNANRYDTLKAMGEYRNTLLKDDNLLIYYAGHGVLDKASERGYWLPTDAERDFTSNWISTAEVTDTLKALKSWHVLVVADSCYSGTLARSISIKFNNPEKKHSLIERLLKKKSRTVITSGGLEPVTDSGGDNHSVFSEALLDVLRNTNDVIEAEEVFSRLRDNVILNADQTPEYSNVRKVGHNGGDFIFRRQ